MTREEWLESAVGLLSPMVSDAVGHALPRVRVSTSWPSRGGLAPKKTRLGECWPWKGLRSDTEAVAHVFISPLTDDGPKVSGILLHELVHAALPLRVKHTFPFKRACDVLGFTGPPAANEPGESLMGRLHALLDPLGPYPRSTSRDARKRRKDASVSTSACASLQR